MKELLRLVDKVRETHPEAHDFKPVRDRRGDPIHGWTFVQRDASSPFARKFMWVARDGELSRDVYRSRNRAKNLMWELIMSSVKTDRIH